MNGKPKYKLSKLCSQKPKIPQSNLINTYFDKIFIINLKRRPDRLENIIKQCTKLNINYQIFNAVDGYTPENLELYQKIYDKPLTDTEETKKVKKPICSPGALGYLYAWKEMILYAKKHNLESFLSLDDDVVFHKDFNGVFREMIVKIPRNFWKIINLGATQLDKFMPTVQDDTPYYHPMICDGSFATAVHYSIYNELLTEIETFTQPFDSGPLRTLYKKYPDNCYVIYPNIIITDVRESNIRAGKDIDLVSRKLAGWNLINFNIPPITTKYILMYLTNETIERYLKNWTDIWMCLYNIRDNCKMWKLYLIIYDDGLSIFYKKQLEKISQCLTSDIPRETSGFRESQIPRDIITNYEYRGKNKVDKELSKKYTTNIIKIDDIINRDI